MLEGLAAWLLRVLHVPQEPHLPPGTPGTARVFRAARNYWGLLLVLWLLRQLMGLVGLVMFTVVLHVAPLAEGGAALEGPRAAHVASWIVVLLRVIEALAWAAFLVQLPISYRLARLHYELRWYIVTDRAARLREGILSMTEMTFTLANVQDIRIRQGPLQRLLGISDVELRTAGGSDPGEMQHGKGPMRPNLHLARFRGVDNAAEIRDLVRARMERARGAGLGDPEDLHHPVASAPASLEAVAAAVARMAEESRALRAVVTNRPG